MSDNNIISNVISIAIIEDIDEIRNNLRDFIKNRPEFVCDTAVESIEIFMRKVPTMFPIDVLLLDIGLPGISGINGIKLIKDKFPNVEIIMITVYDDQDRIFQALCEGASGYLLKNTPFPKIEEAIKDIYKGGAPMSPQIARKVLEKLRPENGFHRKSILTDKEKEIVAGLVDGQSYKMIAANLEISIETVRHHIKNIYQKLQVHSKGEVITKSLRGEI